jgi:hypothetical protein
MISWQVGGKQTRKKDARRTQLPATKLGQSSGGTNPGKAWRDSGGRNGQRGLVLLGCISFFLKVNVEFYAQFKNTLRKKKRTRKRTGSKSKYTSKSLEEDGKGAEAAGPHLPNGHRTGPAASPLQQWPASL